MSRQCLSLDRAVHVRLRSEVDHGARPVKFEEFIDQGGVSDISPHEDVPRIAFQLRQILRVPGVSQLIQINNGIRLSHHPIEHEIGSDKTGPAGYKDTILERERIFSHGLG